MLGLISLVRGYGGCHHLNSTGEENKPKNLSNHLIWHDVFVGFFYLPVIETQLKPG